MNSQDNILLTTDQTINNSIIFFSKLVWGRAYTRSRLAGAIHLGNSVPIQNNTVIMWQNVNTVTKTRQKLQLSTIGLYSFFVTLLVPMNTGMYSKLDVRVITIGAYVIGWD